MFLSQLPVELLLLITWYLSIRDILSLKQTCRALHLFTGCDYLWHQLAKQNTDVPLDLDSRDVTSLSAEILQQALLKARALERNWRRAKSQVHKLVSIPPFKNNVTIEEMHILPGGRWLVTAQRNRPRGKHSTTFTVWNMHAASDVYVAASMEVVGDHKHFSVDLNERANSACLAVALTLGTQDAIKTLHIPLSERLGTNQIVHNRPKLLCTFIKPESAPGQIDEVAIHDNAVIATLVDVGSPAQSLLVGNVMNGAQRLLELPYQSSSRISVRIEGEYVLVSHSSRNTRFISFHTMPRLPTSTASHYPIPLLDSPIMTYRVPLPNAADARMSSIAEWLQEPHLTLLAFDLGGHVHCTRMPTAAAIPPSGSYNVSHVHMVQQPSSTSAEMISVGAHRAVWLQRNWEEDDELRLMKMWWSPAAAVRHTMSGATLANGGGDGDGGFVPQTGELFPAYPELPFRPRECRSLAFDERSGRLCLGVLGGGWFLLDFAPARRGSPFSEGPI